MGPGAARRIELLNYALGAIAVAAAAFVCSKPQVLGLLVGALLGALNFSAIRSLVEKQLAAQKQGQSSAGVALVFPKMLVLGGAVAAALFLLPISPVFLAAGFSIFMISIAIETVRFLTGTREPATTNGKDGND